MFSYVARQPILDRDKSLFAYELLFRNGEENCFPNICPDEATSRILTNNHLGSGLEDITSGKLAFINFHHQTLLNHFPSSLDSSLVVVEIVESVEVNDSFINACKSIKNLGFRLVLDDHDFDPKWDTLLPLIDIIKVDIIDCDHAVLLANLDKCVQSNIKLVAEKIETFEQFEQYKALGFDYFQGYFFARPEIIKQKTLPTSKSPLVDLICESANVDFDFGKVNSIIERDVSLSYKLLRFINNPLINKSNQITSLRHALNYMGEVEVKKFIALVALANIGDDKTIELLHLSLVRAKFCDLISLAKKRAANPPTGFLIGLFSLLDALLDLEMEDIVRKLPLVDELKFALCGEENELNGYLMLVKAYEVGYWEGISRIALRLNLEVNLTQQFYHEAIKWGYAMTKLIDSKIQ